METSLQERYAPEGICFGCGPANPKGLRIRSVPRGDEVVCEFRPEPHHDAFRGFLNGGIIGTLFDCHMNWTGAWHLMQAGGLDRVPPTVTAEFTVKMRRPTPSGDVVTIRAHVVEASADRATVEAVLEAQGQVTASCRAVFVAVREGHPAWHRW
jgi:acyl-coenzyme A thioesterase PaaI-like protein